MKSQTAAELVGRLNPRSTALEVSQKNPFALTALDIAGAIGMLKLEIDRLWLHVIYAHHLTLSDSLEMELLAKVVDKMHHGGPKTEPGFVRGMIWTAVTECVSQPICPTCNGSKQIILTQEEADKLSSLTMMKFKAGQPVICEDCHGGGYVRKSNYWRAQMCGIHRDLWGRNPGTKGISWNDRYETILDMVRLTDDRAKGAIAGKLDY